MTLGSRGAECVIAMMRQVANDSDVRARLPRGGLRGLGDQQARNDNQRSPDGRGRNATLVGRSREEPGRQNPVEIILLFSDIKLLSHVVPLLYQF
jgi:hypothetical protein